MSEKVSPQWILQRLQIRFNKLIGDFSSDAIEERGELRERIANLQEQINGTPEGKPMSKAQVSAAERQGLDRNVQVKRGHLGKRFGDISTNSTSDGGPADPTINS